MNPWSSLNSQSMLFFTSLPSTQHLIPRVCLVLLPLMAKAFAYGRRMKRSSTITLK